MHIEILCTGDELLNGQTADTNSFYFMQRLFEMGEAVRRVQMVGDSRGDIAQAILDASSRADAVLVSGGLGPTSDDVTAAAAAQAGGVALYENAEALSWVKERLASRGLLLLPQNAKQARVPEGATVVKNPQGSAPMFIMSLGRCTFFFIAGVPREYVALVDAEVLPRLRAMAQARPGKLFRKTRVLKTAGLPESRLDSLVAKTAQAHPNVVFGFRTLGPENHLKLTAQAEREEAAESELATVEAECRLALAPFCFGADGEELGDAIGKQLLQRGETVSLAESLTAGMATSLLAGTPGASKYLRGGCVTYQDEAKVKWLGVREETLLAHGAVSEAVAKEMAHGIRIAMGTTYGLSATGFAGPEGGTESNPVGTVYIALDSPGGQRVQRYTFTGDRTRIRTFAAYAVADLLRRFLEGAEEASADAKPT